jgi:MGT family glycosyltransferase
MCPTLFTHRPFTPAAMRGTAHDPAAERERLAAFGTQLVQLMAEHGLPGLTPTDFAPRPGEPVVVHAPPAFQYADGAAPQEGVHAVGRVFEPPTGAWCPPPGAGPVLLLSLGTSSNDQPRLLASCVAAFAGSRWHVVLTLGAGVDPAELGALPGNVEVHRWLPHGEVLPHASAAVSHGGMGSVLEALAAGVPVVAIPTHPEAVANGRRVAAAGLGRCIPHEEISGPAVRAAVDALVDGIAAEPEAARRLREARTAFRAGGGSVAAADIIEAAARGPVR